MNLLKAFIILLLLLLSSGAMLAQNPVTGKWKVTATTGLDASLPAHPAEQARRRYNWDAAALTFFRIIYKYTTGLRTVPPCDLFIEFDEDGKLETIARCDSSWINYSEGNWGYKSGEVELFGLTFFDVDVQPSTNVIFDVDTGGVNTIRLSRKINKKLYSIRLERVETTPAGDIVFEEPVYIDLNTPFEYDTLNPPPPPPPPPPVRGKKGLKSRR